MFSIGTRLFLNEFRLCSRHESTLGKRPPLKSGVAENQKHASMSSRAKDFSPPASDPSKEKKNLTQTPVEEDEFSFDTDVPSMEEGSPMMQSRPSNTQHAPLDDSGDYDEADKVKANEAALSAKGPAKLSLAHLTHQPVPQTVSFTPLGGDKIMISRHFASFETPLSLKVRHVILGYTSVKLTEQLLQVYCRTHNLEPQRDLLVDIVRNHVETTLPRYIVFIVAWKGHYSQQKDGLISFTGSICVRHGGSGESASFEVDGVTMSKGNIDANYPKSSDESMKMLKAWIQEKCSAVGASAQAVLLPMATDGMVISLAKALDAILIQDSIGLCTSVFFDHISRVKGMVMPDTIEGFGSVLGGMISPSENQESTEKGPKRFGTIQRIDLESDAASQARRIWNTAKRSLKHLGNKLAAEEQMLGGLRGILDICLVSYTNQQMEGGQSGHILKLYSCSQRRILKTEAQNPADVMMAISEYFKAQARMNIAICALDDTTIADLEHLARFNGNRSLNFRVFQLTDLFRGKVSEVDPSMAWKRIVSLFKSEGHALSYALNRFQLQIKHTTLGYLPNYKKDMRGQLFDHLGSKKTNTLANKQENTAATELSMTERPAKWSDKKDREIFSKYRSTLFTNSRHLREKALLPTYKRYLVLDLETTTVKFQKRVASPFTQRNFVVLPGYLDYNGKLTIPDEKLTERKQMKLPDLANYDVLVGHNLKFDLLWLWEDPNLRAFFARGGKIWDTMYAEYLISGQACRVGTGIGLNQVAVRYGGTRKRDEVKALWDQGINTSDIAYETLRPYLEGDLRNTHVVFQKQLEAALHSNQIEVIRSRMDVVLCTSEMEYNGLKMNRIEGKKQYDILREEIQECKKKLRMLIPDSIAPMLRPHWNWNSTFVLSAMYWGGTAKIAEDNMLGTPKGIGAAVELAVRAGGFAPKLRAKYGTAFLKAMGMRTTGKVSEVVERIKSFVLEKCPNNFQLFLLGGFDESDPWIFNPVTGKGTKLCKHLKASYPYHSALESVSTDFNAKSHRALCVTYDTSEVKIDEYSIANGLHYDDAVVFFARVKPLLGEVSCRSETELLERLREKCILPCTSRKKTLTMGESKAVLLRLGSTLGLEEDCFVLSCESKPDVHVTFPGKVFEYYPEEKERENFMKKNKTEKGKMAVGVQALEQFATKGESIAKALLEMRAKTKLLSTYYETDGTGMMSLINDSDNCIHHELSLCHTATSRMASANPNMQNVPKTDEIRKLFISRFGADGVLVETDYSQLEVVVLCALSQDPQMIADIKNKVDFHCKRVTMMKPQYSYEEVFRRAKKDKEQEFCDLRQKAKIFSFQRQYGAGVNKLSESTGLSTDEIRALIKNEEIIYAKVKEFYRLVEHSVNGWNAGLQDASRSTSGNYSYKGEFRVLTGTRFTFGQIERSAETVQRIQEYNKNAQPMAFLQTQLKNYPIQGFAGEIVQVMLGLLWRHFVANRNYEGKAVLTNTVHDCVWVDCHKDVVFEVASDVKRVLNSVQEVFNKKWPELKIDVPFSTETTVGRTMAKMKDIEKVKTISDLP